MEAGRVTDNGNLTQNFIFFVCVYVFKCFQEKFTLILYLPFENGEERTSKLMCWLVDLI